MNEGRPPRPIHMVIPAMRKPKTLDDSQWAKAIVDCCRTFLTMKITAITLVSDSSIRTAVRQLQKESEFRFIELDYEPKGALATVCMALDSYSLAEIAIGICPADTVVSKEFGDVVDEFVKSESKCQVLAFDIPESAADSSWSYVHTVGDGLDRIAMIAEGTPSSPIATSGVFLFRNSEIFLKAAKWCFVNQTKTNDQYFASSAVNFLIAKEELVDVKILGPKSFEKASRERYFQ